MRYKSFFTKSACGLLVCKNDKYSTIIEANDAFYNMIGYTREEMHCLYKDRFAELVIDYLNKIKVEIQGFEVSVSVGVVFDKSGSCNFKDLYKYADKMLYRAKGKNKGRYEFKIIL